MAIQPNPKKKIVIDAKAITTNMDGLGLYSVYFINELRSYFKDKYEICIILPPSVRNVTISAPLDIKNTNIIFSDEERFRGRHEFDFQKWDNFISALSPDIYISTSFITTNYNCPKVVVIHDIAPIVYAAQLNPIKVTTYSKVIEKAMSNGDLIITNSHNTATDVRRVFPESNAEIKVLYPSIVSLINRVKPDVKTQVRKHGRFLVVGVKCPRKNIGLVIEALKILKQRNMPECKVYFIGNIREHDVAISKFVVENSLQDVATILGYVSDEEMIHLIRGSRGLLFPSQYEGFGMSLIEFLAAGKPIICTKNSSIPEVVDNFAYYSLPTPSKFADVILQVSNSEPKPKQNIERHLQKLININRNQFLDVFSWIEKRLVETSK